MAVSMVRLHELFMTGMKIADIAAQLGITEQSCQTYISNERNKNPFSWPLRKGKRAAVAPTGDDALDAYMHLYECTECFCKFAVEDYEEIDHSQTQCPICHSDQSLEDAGYGYFTKTKEPEVSH